MVNTTSTMKMKKRLSKGERHHIRRVKAAARQEADLTTPTPVRQSGVKPVAKPDTKVTP